MGRATIWKCCRKKEIDGIANVLSQYTRMNGANKPEVTSATTYSNTNFNEAQRVLAKANDIEDNAKKYYNQIPELYKDAYYQLVYYPAVASANVKKMQIYGRVKSKVLWILSSECSC